MLGKTNLLFVAEDEAAELAFKPEYILTSSSSNILKIEYINNLYFVFTSDDKVLYGSDINSLQTLKKDGSPFPATYIIYKNNAYYMITKESNTEQVVVYKTSNLTSFEEIVIRRENSEERYDSGSTITYCAGALLLTSDNRIAMLYSKTEGDFQPRIRFILCDTFDSFDHVGNNFIEFNEYLECDCNKTYMLKDRIFSYYASNSMYLITLDGSLQKVNPFSNYAVGYFFYVSSYTASSMSSRKLAVHYSLNGVDYQAVQLDIPAYNVSTTKGVSFFEYDGNIVMLYPDENDGMSQKIVISTTPKGLADATKTAMPVSVDYGIQTKIGLYKDDYVYLGCTGGIVIKGQIENAEVERPDVVVIKGLAAKEALRQANDYTDEKYKNTSKEVKEIEETTRQYMESAFSATPEGYAELVDTVHENTAKLDIVIEKAELNIKETAKGEEIYLTDSDGKKLVELALFGKAKQNTTSGKNLLENTATSQTINGVTFTVNNDGSVTANGTPTENTTTFFNVKKFTLPKGDYILSSGTFVDSTTITQLIKASDNTVVAQTNKANNASFSIEDTEVLMRIRIASGYNANNLTFYPMIRLASITDSTYEPYTGGIPSPNPEYPQEIEVSGESYNFFRNEATSRTESGVDFTVNEDGSVTANGTATNDIYFALTSSSNSKNLGLDGEYIITNGISNGSATTFYCLFTNRGTEDKSDVNNYRDLGDGVKVELNSNNLYRFNIVLKNGYKAENLTFKPMIRKASVKNDRYMPYGVGSVEVKSYGKNLLANNYYSSDSYEYGGLIYKKQEDGTVLINGETTAVSSYRYAYSEINQSFMKKLIGKTLTISMNTNSNDVYYTCNFVKNGSNILTHNAVKESKTFIVPEHDEIRIYFRIASGLVFSNVVASLQIEVGTVATEYEPYKETAFTFQTKSGLPGIPVSSGGNHTDENEQKWICDEIVKYADGSGKHVQRIGKADLESLNWVYNETYFTSSNLVGLVKEPNSNHDKINALSSCFRVTTYNGMTANNNLLSIIWKDSASHGQVWCRANEITDVQTFTEKVSGQYLYYELATPIHTPLTAEQIAEIEKLCTFYPITHITNDGGCEMEVVYLADSKNYIDRKVAEQVASIVENMK